VTDASVVVRRVRLQEWREIRDLRIEAVSDPAAGQAFLNTREEEVARDDDFWRDRAAGAALGESAAQFVAIDGDRWVASATVLLREPGTRDALGRDVTQRRADVVGVYVAQSHRGAGILGRLFDAAEEWAAKRGTEGLTLDVHRDNARAQAAYRKAGFSPTGATFTSTIGPELEMHRPPR
jgi:GNAT superfamily N-acetyltransferase